MRRPGSLTARLLPAVARGFAVAPPWKSELPAPTDECWEKVGTAVVEAAQQLDSGPDAFEECLTVRRQLETVVKGCGFDNLGISIFGGMVSNRMLETGGDVDFVAVSDSSMTFEEQSAAVSKLGREMRRVGLRATSLPRARVPVVKVDRVSSALPGAPLHSMATSAVFQLIAPATPEQQAQFDDQLRNDYGAGDVEWSRGQQLATARFPDTDSAVRALANVHRIGDTLIPLRLPLEPKQGPELFRFPFDLCLQSSGLQNSHLIAHYLDMWEYSRHLLLLIKRWGRSSGVVNSIDGLLASYGLTVLVVHYLVRIGRIPPLDVTLMQEPQFLPNAPTYKPLVGAAAGDVSELGYLAAGFFEYYANVFDPEQDVAATTAKIVTKETLRWAKRPNPDGVPRPPHHFLCIKDPYNTENIGRNLDANASHYVRSAFVAAHSRVRQELADPGFLVSLLTSSAPRP
eukprot:CAMPEP_0174832928 /NCGR_PEP_ID=MMETSP1114-20130205/3933_1 /TAXON_ID=312471 /ORGANISM="Neobodo designis, Strain CCAP 1951/1" /LENGTH=457 /DNA_ID=CAMNT_0016066795 /DNA_START=41 /DNA_END=1411 /DNA_ORIENTATION=+